VSKLISGEPYIGIDIFRTHLLINNYEQEYNINGLTTIIITLCFTRCNFVESRTLYNLAETRLSSVCALLFSLSRRRLSSQTGRIYSVVIRALNSGWSGNVSRPRIRGYNLQTTFNAFDKRSLFKELPASAVHTHAHAHTYHRKRLKVWLDNFSNNNSTSMFRSYHKEYYYCYTTSSRVNCTQCAGDGDYIICIIRCSVSRTNI